MTTKSVLKMLEDNRKTVMALNNSAGMDVDMRPVVEIVEEILRKDEWKDQRASKLDLDAFLQLMTEFNEAGIHFS